MNQPVRPAYPVYILMLVPRHVCPIPPPTCYALVEDLASGDGGVSCRGCGAWLALSHATIPVLAHEVQRSRTLNGGYRVRIADLDAAPAGDQYRVAEDTGDVRTLVPA